MTTSWQKVDSKCKVCRASVGKISIKNGKIAVEKRFDNWGCWQKIKGKSEMEVMCSLCQKKASKEKRKHRSGTY